MIDNVCKFLAESYSTDFASWLIGKPITLTKIEQSELAVDSIRADSVIFLESAEIILHIEFQTEPNQNIPFRMTDYRLRLYRKYPQKKSSLSRHVSQSQPITHKCKCSELLLIKLQSKFAASIAINAKPSRSFQKPKCLRHFGF